ncbi:hypothetical protein [Pseudokordiimonas caeni]|uniref:hypothetical protein n=1 Tax=Pseudokordiimonas caeni TaxID=2997908 RepID=UPI002811E847|nr:hypothetical protein [Pseudokordiimonas caeni]
MSAAKRLATEVGVHWPLPKPERESLAAIILKVAERALVPLASATGRDPAVRIADDGRFEVAFVLDPAFVKPVGTGDPVTRAMIRAVSEAVAFSKEWIAGPRETLVYKSSAAHTFLIRPEMPAAEGLTRLGLTGLPKCPVLKNLCAAFIEAGKLASRNDADRTRMVIAAIAGTIPVAQQDANGRKFKGLIDDRSALERLEENFSGEQWASFDDAIRKAVDRADATQAALVKIGPSALAIFADYFKTGDPKAVQRVSYVLARSIAFLANLTRSKVLSWRHVVGRTDDASEAVAARFKSENTLAVQYGGYIFIRLGGMHQLDANLWITFLHEAVHTVIPDAHQRKDGRDPAYRHEAIFADLTTEQALDNPDSYIALVVAITGEE